MISSLPGKALRMLVGRDMETTRIAFFISSLPGKALSKLVDIARLAQIWRILGECLLISSLPGKALRTLVDITRLAQI